MSAAVENCNKSGKIFISIKLNLGEDIFAAM